MEKYKGLPLRLSELGLARITRQTGYAVHFEIMQRYYVLLEHGEGFKLYLKPLRGGRGHWKEVCGSWGDMPRPRYFGKRRVYAQADIRSWMLALAGKGIITLIREDGNLYHRWELLKVLPAEDFMAIFGVTTRVSRCDKCDYVKRCPVGKLGVHVHGCLFALTKV